MLHEKYESNTYVLAQKKLVGWIRAKTKNVKTYM